MNKKVLSSAIDPETRVLDHSLRPRSFSEYVGQTRVKENLAILIAAAKKRTEPLEHILLHGPAGLGKTTLAYLIASEMGSSIKITSGAALVKAGDIGSILTNLNNGDVLFIDEAHRLNKLVEEILYPAMETFSLDLVVGKGPSARTLRIDLPRFTLIAATTRVSLLSSPFRSRFGVHHKLSFYTEDEMAKIIHRSSTLLNAPIDDEAVAVIARAGRATPRVANRLLKRTRDLAQVENIPCITREIAEKTLAMLEIDEIGLEAADRAILSVILTSFRGGPVGLKTIAAALAEEEETVAEVYEPYLMQIGFLARTSRGRVITPKACAHLKMPLPQALFSSTSSAL